MRDKPDFYAQKAQKEGFPARSVYKLEEIQTKFSVVRKGQTVLDIGASPGSWTLFVLNVLKDKGRIMAVDINPLNLKQSSPLLTFVQGDIFSSEIGNAIAAFGPFDTVLSDAAPSTTGNRTVDTGRSLSLVEAVLDIGERVLKPGGNLVVKLFQGGDEQGLIRHLRTRFDTVKPYRPKAVRKDSFETYLVCLGKKGGI